VLVGDLVQTAVSAVQQDGQGYSTKTWETGPLKSEAQGLGLSVDHVCSIWAALYVTCLLLLSVILCYTSTGAKCSSSN
jgi:hypothetical protein